ncbi:MAG: hypothetical protein R3Y46_03055 [Opitutales bacterium]
MVLKPYSRPIVDLSLIYRTGDLYSESTSSFTDIIATSLSIEAYNTLNYNALFGFEFKKNNTRIGLSYSIEASENITSHNFRVNYRYAF